MKKLLNYLIIFLIIICISSTLLHGENVKEKIKNIPLLDRLYSLVEKKEKPKVKIGDIEIKVDIAESASEKAKGLSSRKKLKGDEGMLFVFENKTMPSFWMKDMNFAIDIIWISNGKIVGIEKSVPAPQKGTRDSELPLYKPPQGIDYVLEVNAEFCEKNNIEIENTLDLLKTITK